MKNKNNGISQKVVDEIIVSLSNLNGWGSVEIFIQNNKVTQITEKNIKKPIISLTED